MLYHRTEKHLWTQIEIQIISDLTDTDILIRDLFWYCADFEAEFSRFLSSSALSKINNKKSLIVSDRFINLLKLSQSLYEETGGKFSPFIDISSLGYSKNFDTGIFKKSASASSHKWDVLIQGNMVTLWNNTTLDFWGIGKWYLVEILSGILRDKWYKNYCINAGWDLFVSWKNSEEQNWIVGIENPVWSDNYASVSLSDRCVTTSGSYRRQWCIDSKEYHHIIDPSSCTNLNNYLSITLIWVSVARVDALTKAIWNTPPWDLENAFLRYNIDGVVIAIDGTVFVSPGCISYYNFSLFQ